MLNKNSKESIEEISNKTAFAFWRYLILYGSLSLPLLSGCLGTPYPFGPIVRNERSPVNSISIQTFKNKTGEAGLDRRLGDALVHELENDHRIAYLSDENKADGVLMGTIRQFNETAVKQQKDGASNEHQLSIMAEIKFLDRTKNKVLWEDELIERRSTFAADANGNNESAELAKTELFQRFAKDIIRRTVEKLGKEKPPVSRKTDDSLPANPPPEYPSTAPF